MIIKQRHHHEDKMNLNILMVAGVSRYFDRYNFTVERDLNSVEM